MCTAAGLSLGRVGKAERSARVGVDEIWGCM